MQAMLQPASWQEAECNSTVQVLMKELEEEVKAQNRGSEALGGGSATVENY